MHLLPLARSPRAQLGAALSVKTAGLLSNSCGESKSGDGVCTPSRMIYRTAPLKNLGLIKARSQLAASSL